MRYGNRKGQRKNTQKELFEMVKTTVNNLIKNNQNVVFTSRTWGRQLKQDHGTDFSSRLRQYPKILKWIKNQQKKHNFVKDDSYCMKKGCLNKVHKIIKNGKRSNNNDGMRVKRLCEQHYQEHLLECNVKNQKRKDVANEAAAEWLETHIDKIKELKLLKKRECLRLIEEFYLNYCLSEPHFRTLLMDLLTLQGGRPAPEYPIYTSTTQYILNPKRADIVERNFKMAIEVKASFFGSTAQHELPDQLSEYKEGFPKFMVLGVSPENRQDLTTSLLDFLKIVIRKRDLFYKKYI